MKMFCALFIFILASALFAAEPQSQTQPQERGTFQESKPAVGEAKPTKKTNYTEEQLPPGTLAGLTEEQKKEVLIVLNENPCPCGCPNDTIAECRINDKRCGTSPRLVAQAVGFVKQGKTAAEVGKILQASNTRTTTVRPGRAQATTFAEVQHRDDDPFKGPKYAKVTIVDFSEFQCPYCRKVLPILKQIQETYRDEVKIVWKHQPLRFHQFAMASAEAAEAAREQGKFWEMHDLLFENQAKLGQANYEEWAKQIGLDVEKFRESIAEHRNLSRIQQDSTLGNSIGARGTPTFFINGRKLVGALPLEDFKKVIDEEIAKADEILKTGQKLDSSFYDAILAQNKKAIQPATN